MKNLITILILLVAVGCGKSEVEKLEAENKRLKAQLENKKLNSNLEADNQKLKDDLLELDIVGEYEFTNRVGDTYTQVFLENGVYEHYRNGDEFPEAKWTVSNGQIHIKYPPSDNIYSYRIIYRINPDRSITDIAEIEDGNRTEKEESYQFTYKKIK